MSSRRSKRGALLALVVVSALVLVILGLGLLLMIMQLGGGQELQHATDAGNLNVAKQVLRHPGTALLAGDELNHFGDTDDQQTNEVNLLTINKLVAQTYLVSANAQALGTANANLHAQQMMDLLEGVSNRLNNELINSGNFDGHFHNVSQNHAMRMFEAGNNPVTHMGTQHGVSLMERNFATNVYLDNNQILNGGPNIGNVTVTGPGGKKFLAGYKQLSVVGPESLWGVPLRPGQPPHLVSEKNFNTDQVRGPIPNFVPPNAFRSAGLVSDQKTSAQNVRAISMAVVGSLDTEFAGDIRRGVIVVDNTGSLSGTQYPGGFDIWQDKLMDPNYIEVMGGSGGGLIADQSTGNSPTLNDVKNFVDGNYGPLTSGDANAQSQLAAMLGGAGIDSWGQFTANPSANASNSQFIDFVHNSGVSRCSNGAPSHSAAPTQMTTTGGEPCNLGKFINLYGEPGSPGTGGSPVHNLMAVEKYHVDMCAERASGSECATINANAANTGLKKYSINDCGLAQIREGTLRELLVQTKASPGGGDGIVPQLMTYMHQMKPSAGGGEIGNVLDSTVAFNRVSYIYLNPATNSLVLSTNVPPWALPDLSIPGMNLPDGVAQTYNRAPTDFSLDGITNCSGECGYPHPWDCPLDSQARGQDTSVWTPSSGFRNILGVIKFRNRAAGGGQFCCPC